MPSVSILMSIYKESIDWATDSINSILQQTFSDIELIIILDNPEYSAIIPVLNSISGADNRLKYYVNDANVGLAESMNRAFQYSSGDYIARMDSDDISFPSRIEKEINYLNRGRYDLIGSNVEYIGNRLGCSSLEIDDRSINREILYSNPLPHPTWLMRRIVFETLGGYRSIGPAQDYEFISRVVRYGFKIGLMKEALVKYRVSPYNTSSSSRPMQIYNLTRVQMSMKYSRDYYSINPPVLNFFLYITESSLRFIEYSGMRDSKLRARFLRYNFLSLYCKVYRVLSKYFSR